MRILFFLLLLPSLGFGAYIPHPENCPDKRIHTLSVAALICNEAEWLSEWIAFHRLVGVDHFYIFNNGSTDHYEEVLRPFQQEGIVELFECAIPAELTQSQMVYAPFALSIARGATEWLAFFDTKEFLTPIAYFDAVELVEMYAQYEALYLYWRVFGTSDVYSLEKGERLIEKLTRRAPDNDLVNRYGRMIVRPGAVNGFVNKHYAILPDPGKVAVIPPSLARINYFFVRTEQELAKMKGFYYGERPLAKPISQAKLMEYMPRANRVQDRTMAPFLKRLPA